MRALNAMKFGNAEISAFWEEKGSQASGCDFSETGQQLHNDPSDEIDPNANQKV
jgi:hypothetical protein